MSYKNTQYNESKAVHRMLKKKVCSQINMNNWNTKPTDTCYIHMYMVFNCTFMPVELQSEIIIFFPF